MSTMTISKPQTYRQDDNAAGIAALRDALVAYSTAAHVGKETEGSLIEALTARYAHHAAHYARDMEGVLILPESDRKTVAALVILDATENIALPPAKERTAGERTLAQYLSRMGTVATDWGWGVPAAADPATLARAYKSISESKREAKETEAAKESAKMAYAAERAYGKWLKSLPEDDRYAFGRVIGILTGNGFPHLDAFTADIRANVK